MPNTNTLDPLAGLVTDTTGPQKAKKADTTPVVALGETELAKARRVANAIAAKKASEAEHTTARLEIESHFEQLRVQLSQQQGRYITTIKVRLGNGQSLKYTKKQTGSGPSGKQQAEQVEAIKAQLGATEAKRFLLTTNSYAVKADTLANAELMGQIIERLGPELVAQLLERVQTVKLAPAFWAEQTLNKAFSDRAQLLEQAGLIKARAGEFAIAK